MNVVFFLLGDFMCRRFGILCSIFVSRVHMTYEDGIYNSDAGESPKRKNTTFTIRRKFEIKNNFMKFVLV
jgi:hypothetical protein